MPKVILEFDSITEQEEMLSAINGTKWSAAMWDLDQELRKTTKYGNSVITPEKEASDIEYQIAEKYRELIREILSGYNLNLEL